MTLRDCLTPSFLWEQWIRNCSHFQSIWAHPRFEWDWCCSIFNCLCSNRHDITEQLLKGRYMYHKPPSVYYFVNQCLHCVIHSFIHSFIHLPFVLCYFCFIPGMPFYKIKTYRVYFLFDDFMKTLCLKACKWCFRFQYKTICNIKSSLPWRW